MSQFDQATSVPALGEAWLRTLKNGGSAGGDGESLAEFARQADFRLARLSHELQSGLYRPGPLRRVQVPKRKGDGMRTLSIPCVADRIAQRASASVLSALLEPQFEDSSFGYRPGRSVAQAVARVDHLRRSGYHHVVDADIRAFFDNVPHASLMTKLQKAGAEPRLCDLVALWLDSFSATGRGLAQGSPLSPVLANLHLDVLDESFGPKSNVRIVRFADDFVLLTRSKPGAEGALARAQDVLAEGGLQLNLAKTRIVAFEDAMRFLGHLFLRGTVLQSEEEDDVPERRHVLSYGGRRDPAEEEEARGLMSAPAVAKPPDPAPERDGTAPDLPDEDELSSGPVPLYLFEPGYRLIADREGFAVVGNGRARLRLPAQMVSRIDLGAEVEADDAALRLAASYGIPVALLNEAGLPQSVLMPTHHDDAALHLAQAELALNPERAVSQAAPLVAARLRNAQALLKRLNRRRALPQVEAACEALKQDWMKAEAAHTLDRIRAIEAEAARTYWPALSACLEHGFALASRRDPLRASPVNAVLDYTASLLTRDMRSAVLRARLHPGFGILHATGDGRDACVYDLVEPFRAPLAEGLSVYLFNNRILRDTDFFRDPDPAPGQHGIRLLPAASRKLVQAWEAWVARPILDPATGLRCTWRRLLLLESQRFAKSAMARQVWVPYRMKH